MPGIEGGDSGESRQAWSPEAPSGADNWSVDTGVDQTKSDDGSSADGTVADLGGLAVSHAESASPHDIGGVAVGDAVEVAPVDDSPVDDTSDFSDGTDRYPSELAEQRTELWERQGQNDLGYQGTCGLASTAEVISDQTGERVTENDVVEYASREGLCVTDSPLPERQGGTDLGQIKAIHQEAGLDASIRSEMNQDDLAREIDSGAGVIAAVKAAEVWPTDAAGGAEVQAADRSQPGTDHAVWVTGVSRSPEGVITGFYTNDTGFEGGAGHFVSADDMARGWEQRGGQSIVSRRQGQ